MSPGTGALMKLIEQPMIDNGAARQRRRHDHPPLCSRLSLSFFLQQSRTSTAAASEIPIIPALSLSYHPYLNVPDLSAASQRGDRLLSDNKKIEGKK